jgi:AcrR family transcriptional regulator
VKNLTSFRLTFFSVNEKVSKHLLIISERRLDKVLETISTRMAGDERRQQILHVAMRLFSEKGFSGTTTKEIAQRAGVSEAMVFRHFANKDELYSAILDHKACNRKFQNPFDELADKMAANDDFGVFYTMASTRSHHHGLRFSAFDDASAFSAKSSRVAVRALIGMFVHHSLNNILWDKEQKLLKISNEDAAREFATILLQGIKK